MIRDPVSALVRISAKNGAPAVGTGFIFHKDRDGVLVLTSKNLISADGEPLRKVWLEGGLEADWVAGQESGQGDLAVFQCLTAELSDREPLNLGQPLAIATARIVYDSALGKAQAKSPICPFYTFRGRDAGTTMILLNNPRHPVARAHVGSPVIDENWAVGVVTDAPENPAGPPAPARNLIRATSVEALRRTWERSAELIAGPVPPDVAQELATPLQEARPFSAKILVAVSDPAGLNDEVAIIQETIARRLPPYSNIELWRWESNASMRRIHATATAPVSDSAPSYGEFDAVILIAWRKAGTDGFAIEEAESATRQFASAGQKRLIYRRADADQSVLAFFKRVGKAGVAADVYEAGEFAETFGRDFQLLLAQLAASADRRSTARRMRPIGDDQRRQPYRGLQVYELEHAHLFNGRSKETSDIRDLLASRKSGLTVVAGASGSGKSSLVRAGLLYRLKLDAIPGSSGWKVLEFRVVQGEPPLKTMATKLVTETAIGNLGVAAGEVERLLTQEAGVAGVLRRAQLGSAGSPLLLFVDQFEEVFTNVDEQGPRLAFLQFLHDAALQDGVHVIVTMRADFYPRLLDRDISSFVQGHEAYWLKPPTEQQMVSAMYWPAAASGYRFENHDLFVQILRDAGTSEGALPILSYALQQLSSADRVEKVGGSWVMTRTGYQEIDGVQGVVERQAAEALARLTPPPSEEALYNLFRRLVKVDETGKPTRKRADFNESDGSWTDDAIRLKKALEHPDARLLTVSAAEAGDNRVPTIELAHEALLDRWKKLAGWTAKYRESLILMQRVEREAQEWSEEQKNAATDLARLEVDRRLLWEQPDLDKAEKARSDLGRSLGELSPEAREFLRPEAERLQTELRFPIGYERRCAIGERLAKLGDPRDGVGLRDGKPHIVWCYVPGGYVTLHGVAHDLATRKIEPYYIAQYPVTLKQFNRFAEGKTDGTDKRVYFQPEWWEGLPVKPGDHAPVQQKEVANHPAQFVSWYQAIAYCKWLSKELGYEIRLPDEWEWVRAATGGHVHYVYPWGPDWDPDKANHRFQAYQLLAVGMYPEGASPVGAYDMVGNMYQWCLGEFDHPDRTAISSEPRTTRGGAFFLMPPDVKVEEQLSIRHRLRDLADGTGDRGRRVAVCIRLATKQPRPGSTVINNYA